MAAPTPRMRSAVCGCWAAATAAAVTAFIFSTAPYNAPGTRVMLVDMPSA